MKSIFLKCLAFSLILVTVSSCEKDQTQIVSNVSPTGTIKSSATALNLTQANGSQTAFTLSLPLPTVTGYEIPITSILQFDIKGNNFTKSKEFVINTNSYSPTVNDFNKMLLALGGTIGTSTQVEVRLKSGAAANATTYSNVITLTATPYSALAWIYVPGAYQGWNPATADSLVSETSNGIYEGVIAYTPGNFGFKITPEKKWDGAFGDAGNGKISTSGGDFNSVTSGLKFLTVDVNAKTWKIENVLQQWSIIGDATPGGWGADTDMKFVNDGKGAWKITTNLTAGAFKFRLNHDWGVNLGGGANLTKGGADIAVTIPGNYTITLNVIDGNPRLAQDKVTGGAYTIVKN